GSACMTGQVTTRAPKVSCVNWPVTRWQHGHFGINGDEIPKGFDVNFSFAKGARPGSNGGRPAEVPAAGGAPGAGHGAEIMRVSCARRFPRREIPCQSGFACALARCLFTGLCLKPNVRGNRLPGNRPAHETWRSRMRRLRLRVAASALAALGLLAGATQGASQAASAKTLSRQPLPAAAAGCSVNYTIQSQW